MLVLGSRFEKRQPPLESFEDDLLDLPAALRKPVTNLSAEQVR